MFLNNESKYDLIEYDENIIYEKMKFHFGYNNFRPFQYDTISSILSQQDCVVVLATGSGKSLCYQLPSLISNKPTIIISPLISLMEDQVMKLNTHSNIRSCFLNSYQNDTNVWNHARHGYYSLIYISPESFLTWFDGVQYLYIHSGLTCFAIDESHCVSQWGHDFRKAYLELSIIRKKIPKVPIMALTATATKRVREDIIHYLLLNKPNIYISSFDRPNLFYEIKRKTNYRHDLSLDKLGLSNESIIIYCIKKKETEAISSFLQEQGVKAQPYHADLSYIQRKKIHQEFQLNQIDIIVATIAFGLGIDKPDIRRIIHYGSPGNIESYYQETGRAGRDGLPSHCLLFWEPRDFNIKQFFNNQITNIQEKDYRLKSLLYMKQFIKEETKCRRKMILEYFDESTNTNRCYHCDNCNRSSSQCIEKEKRDFTEPAEIFLSNLADCSPCGLKLVINLCQNKIMKSHQYLLKWNIRKKDLITSGKLQDKSTQWLSAFADTLLYHNCIQVASNPTNWNKKFATLYEVSNKGKQIINKQYQFIIEVDSQIRSAEQIEHEDKEIKQFRLPSLNSNEENGLTQFLKQLRMNQASIRNIYPFHIMNDSTLALLVKCRPTTQDNFLSIPGININIAQQYGQIFTQSIEQYCIEFSMTMNNMDFLSNQNQLNNSSITSTSILTETKENTYNLFTAGMSISQICEERKLKRSTILGHLADCINRGLLVDISKCDIDFNTSNEIERVIEEIGSYHAPSIYKEKLPPQIDYSVIKIILAKYINTHPTKTKRALPFTSSSTKNIKNKKTLSSPSPTSSQGSSPSSTSQWINIHSTVPSLDSIRQYISSQSQGVSLQDLQQFFSSSDPTLNFYLSQLQDEYSIYYNNQLYYPL